MPRVFLSYARVDGEGFAADLRARFEREARDIEIVQDRLLLEGGVGWWKQITDAIDAVEFLVLVMTPAAIASGNVQKEWRYARQQGVCVYPVKGTPDLAFAKMPRWMSKAHFFDVEKEWPTFIAHLRKGCSVSRVPFMAPDLPRHFVQRPVEFDALKNLLLSPDRSQPVAITTALAGAGGFGKTTLAAALCHDEDVVQNFDDGILWVRLGQTPDVLGALVTVYAALTGERPGFATVEDAAFHLGEKLDERTFLLVIDDVWDSGHLRPFVRGGKSSARLFTTRNGDIASECSPVLVDEMREGEALEMLTRGVTNLDRGVARRLANKLGEWPIALELAAAMMRARVRQGDSARHAAERLLTIIERRGVEAIEDPTAERRHRTITNVLEVSLELLDADDRRKLTELSIFPEGVAIPLAALTAVWGLDDLDAEVVAQRFARLSLVKLDLERGVLRLHDVMRTWLASKLGPCSDVHKRLVDSWGDWRALPEWPGNYAWRWLTWHLVQAGRKQEVERILWDPKWMQAKLKATDVNSLIADLEHVKNLGGSELLQGALRLSNQVLENDPGQFAPQLVGRLLPHRDFAGIGQFLIETCAAAPALWLRPLRGALHPPGTGLVHTLEGHSFWVTGVAITPDGKRAVSVSYDYTVKVWDLETGGAVRTLEGHSDWVNAVSMTTDGKRAISASDDYTLKIWDLETGEPTRTLEGHSNRVNSVTVALDGKQVVSASYDEKVKVWSVETGEAIRTLQGHSAGVNSVAMTPDGTIILSASSDETLKVWNADTGRVIRTLEGHSGSINSVAVASAGKRAVSGSSDKALIVWDLETGRALRKLQGHSDAVNSVAFTREGNQVISASSDRTLKVWDVETGSAVRTLAGHSDVVTAVAVSSEGKRAVSASYDKTLKVWDLETDRAPRTLDDHSSWVNCVAVTLDKKRAVSASYDRTLKVWDVDTGGTLGTLQGHSDRVNSVAVTPDGKRAVSASSDSTLIVWDLESCRPLGTFEGHADRVNAVGITPDGKRALSASSDRTLKLWDIEARQIERTLEHHSVSFHRVAVMPEEAYAVSASSDKVLRIWDLRTGTVRILGGHTNWITGLSVAGNGRRAVSASYDKTLIIWDLHAGRAVRTLEAHSSWLSDVAVSADGERAISASYDKTLTLWDLQTGKPLSTFHCDTPAVCCTFAGERLIVAGDAGGKVHFLQIEEVR